MHQLTALFPDAVARRTDVVKATSSSSVSRWLARGDLVLVQPGVVALPQHSAHWAAQARAAMLWTGGYLSHLSALHAADLLTMPDGPVHVTVPVARCPRGGSGVIAHRSDRRLVTVRCGHFEVLQLERSLVDACLGAFACS